MFSFFKKIFTISDLSLPAIKLRMPTLNLNVSSPTVMGKSVGIKLFWPNINIQGGAVKVGLLGSAFGLIIVTAAYFLAIKGIDAAPIYPEAATYDVGQAHKLERPEIHVGNKNTFPDSLPDEERATQTLMLVVGGARMDELNFDTISVGKATGLAEAVKIFGTTTNTLMCDTITLDGIEAPSLYLANSNVYKLTIKDNYADGFSIAPTLYAVSDITVGSTRGAINIPAASGSTYDRIMIDTSSADSICDNLILKDIKVFGTYSGYAIHLENLDVGELIIKNSIIGDGTGIDVPSFTATSTKTSVVELTNNVERPITIK